MATAGETTSIQKWFNIQQQFSPHSITCWRKPGFQRCSEFSYVLFSVQPYSNIHVIFQMMEDELFQTPPPQEHLFFKQAKLQIHRGDKIQLWRLKLIQNLHFFAFQLHFAHWTWVMTAFKACLVEISFACLWEQPKEKLWGRGSTRVALHIPPCNPSPRTTTSGRQAVWNGWWSFPHQGTSLPQKAVNASIHGDSKLTGVIKGRKLSQGCAKQAPSLA